MGIRIPKETRERTLLRLEPELDRYIDAGVASTFLFEFRGDCLYVAARERQGSWRPDLVTAPLCRLRYTGDPDCWLFEIYLYSARDYDADQDFPFPAGTPEECFAVAADFYLFRRPALDAGSSRGKTDTKRGKENRGLAALRAHLARPDAVEAPPGLPRSLPRAGRPLLADMDAFLGFIVGRTLDLAPRSQGLRQKPLAEVNERMGRPARLGVRPVQRDAPRVQCCFETARALGLLRVIRTMHRAEATPEVERYRAMDEAPRLWAVLEALWNRVSWADLKPGAYGNADWHQAGRYWLGAELARRAEPIEFDHPLTGEAEVLEVCLLPFWRDAGLVKLTSDRRMPVLPHLAGRSTQLARIEPTGAGRRVFTLLAESSPEWEHIEHEAEARDGRWRGEDFLWRLGRAGGRVVYPDEWDEEE